MPLISTLQKRVNPVTIADFEAVPGLKYLSVFPETHQASVNYWNDNIDYTPQQIEQIFKDQLDNGFELEITSDRLGEFLFLLSHPEHGRHKQNYNLNYNYVSQSDTRLEKSAQGTKIGRDITMRFIDLDVALGVRRILFSAELAVGGYAWAKMGYELDRGDSGKRLEIDFLSKILLSKLSVLKGVIPSAVSNFAKVYARLSNSDDLYELAQLGEDLSNCINMEDFEEGGFLLQSLKEKFSDEDSALRAADRMKKVVIFCQENSRPLTIGKLLLMGQSWRAVVDYNNDAQMERILKYGGESTFSQLQQIVQQPSLLKRVKEFALS